MSDHREDGFRSCPASPFGELPIEDAPAAKRAAARAEAEASRTADTVAVPVIGRGDTDADHDTNPLALRAIFRSSAPGTSRDNAPQDESDAGPFDRLNPEDVPATRRAERKAAGCPEVLAERGAERAQAANTTTTTDAAEAGHVDASNETAEAAQPETPKRGRVRGPRLPELMDDGDGYTLPGLARRFDGDGAFRESAAPSEVGLRFHNAAYARSEDELPQAPHTPRAVLLAVLAVFMIGFGAVAPSVAFVQLVWAMPVFVLAAVFGLIGFITGDQPRWFSGLLTVACLAAASLCFFAPSWILNS